MATKSQQDIGEDVKGVLSLQGEELNKAVWLTFNDCAHEWLSRWGSVMVEAMVCRHCGKEVPTTDWDPQRYCVPHYSTSHDAIRPVVERAIVAPGRIVFLAALMVVRYPEDAYDVSELVESFTGSQWMLPVSTASDLITATPEQLCKAVLLCYTDKRGRVEGLGQSQTTPKEDRPVNRTEIETTTRARRVPSDTEKS